MAVAAGREQDCHTPQRMPKGRSNAAELMTASAFGVLASALHAGVVALVGDQERTQPPASISDPTIAVGDVAGPQP